MIVLVTGASRHAVIAAVLDVDGLRALAPQFRFMRADFSDAMSS